MSRFSTKVFNKQELKNIKVAVHRRDIPQTDSPDTLQRDLVDPEGLVVHVKYDERQHAIFNRDDIRVNEEFHELVVLKEPDQSTQRNKSCLLHSEPAQLENCHKIRNLHSRQSRSTSSSFLDEEDYRKRKKHSKEHSISIQRPPYKNFEEHTLEEYEVFDVRKSKDEIRSSDRNKSRSRSSRYTRRRPSPQQDRVKKPYTQDYSTSKMEDYKVCNSLGNENEHGDNSLPCNSDAEYRGCSKLLPSTDRRTRNFRRYDSPDRKSCCFPHKSETCRVAMHSEYRSHKHEPSPYKNRSADAERHRSISRSTSRTRILRSRSPYRPDRMCKSSRRSLHRSESYRHYRKDNHSPSHCERYKEHSRHYGRSKSRESYRFRKSSHRFRDLSPSPYSERLKSKDIYPRNMPPLHIPTGPVGPMNYGPLWYPWPQPLDPRFILPHGPVGLRRPPFLPLPGITQRVRPPMIYNAQKFTLGRTPSASATTCTVTSPTSSNSISVRSATAISTSVISGTVPLVEAGNICESTTNMNPTVNIRSVSKETTDII